MLDTLVAIAKLDHPGETSDDLAFSMLYGNLPDGIGPEHLKASCGDQTSIRKFNDRLAIAVPFEQKVWHVWLFDRVPPVTELPQLAQKVSQLSKTFWGGVTPDLREAPKDTNTVDLVLSRLAETKKRDAKTVYQHIANAAVEASLAEKMVVGQFKNGRLKIIAMTDQRMAPIVDEIGTIVREVADAGDTHRHVAVSDLSEDALDEALLAEMAQSDGMTINLAADDHIAFVAFGADRETLESEFATLRKVAKLARHKHRLPSLRSEVKRAAFFIAAAGLLVWLALPAPLRVTVTALSEPQSTRVLSLPVGAFLDRMNVQVGDVVQKGDVIAELRAPDLEEQRLTYRLEKKVEEVAAQTALSENDYGAYLLSQQKLKAADARLDSLDRRIESLTFTAPTSGRIVQSLAGDGLGGFHQLGEAIAMIQPDAQFSILLTVSRVDAALLKPGQTGEVWFRGIPRRTWSFETRTPVTKTVNPANAEESLTLRGDLMGENQETLFAGLSGFGKIDVGREMRAKVYGRYVIEFLRTKAWTWFDLRF